jgi:hypothetical protein
MKQTFKRESSHTSIHEMDYCGSMFQKGGLGMWFRRNVMMGPLRAMVVQKTS